MPDGTPRGTVLITRMMSEGELGRFYNGVPGVRFGVAPQYSAPESEPHQPPGGGMTDCRLGRQVTDCEGSIKLFPSYVDRRLPNYLKPLKQTQTPEDYEIATSFAEIRSIAPRNFLIMGPAEAIFLAPELAVEFPVRRRDYHVCQPNSSGYTFSSARPTIRGQLRSS